MYVIITTIITNKAGEFGQLFDGEKMIIIVILVASQNIPRDNARH